MIESSGDKTGAKRREHYLRRDDIEHNRKTTVTALKLLLFSLPTAQQSNE